MDFQPILKTPGHSCDNCGKSDNTVIKYSRTDDEGTYPVHLCASCQSEWKVNEEKGLTKWEAAKAWMKNNLNLFEKEHLIARAQAYYGLTPNGGLELYEMIMKEIKVETTIKEWIQKQRMELSDVIEEGWYPKWKPTGHLQRQQALAHHNATYSQGPKMSKKLSPEEEDALEKFLFITKADPAELKAKQDTGKFSKIGMIISIAKWYEEKGFVTAKQYDVLKKNVFDKVNDPAWMRKHKEVLSEMIKKGTCSRCKKFKKILSNGVCTSCYLDLLDQKSPEEPKLSKKESTTSGWGYKQYTVTPKKREKQ